MISSENTFVLLIFLAECVCFLTYIEKLISNLGIIWAQSKEKQTYFDVVGLGLSLDILYIYNKVK